MIDFIARWIAARFHQRRVRARLDTHTEWQARDTAAEWQRLFPGKCMYCSYTRWANDEQGQTLKFKPHNCVEGNSPPAPLPIAKVIK